MQLMFRQPVHFRAANRSPWDQVLRLPPHLTPDLARQFQEDYYARVRPGLRLVSLLLAGLTAAHVLAQSGGPSQSDQAAAFPMLFFWLCVFGLTWVRNFGRVWQPILVLLSWIAAVAVLGGIGHSLTNYAFSHGSVAHPPPPVPQRKFLFALQVTVLMVTLSTLRLQYRWTALLQVGVLGIGLWSFRTNLPHDTGRDLHFILLPAGILLLALLLAAFTQEQLARGVFYAGHLLEEERDGERRQREQTEGQLRVLAQAIGGIVHDLGNPLTTVQVGAETAQTFLADETPNRDALQEVTGLILDGAQMLGALRLSLIEQTRVLEGNPIPVSLWDEPLRAIVEAGVRFQNSRLTAGRVVSLAGEELEVYADRLKLVTVFMNLIGNALKYSDGEVRIVWRMEADFVLVGVLDQGTAGRGISEAQARRLFVPFGRLESHADVEGTGLGLVSARKIVEAHGGEVFVEGHSDVTPFSTAQGRYASLLAPGFLTGFVLVCPTPPELP